MCVALYDNMLKKATSEEVAKMDIFTWIRYKDAIGEGAGLTRTILSLKGAVLGKARAECKESQTREEPE